MKFIFLYLDRKATSWSLVLRRHWKKCWKGNRESERARVTESLLIRLMSHSVNERGAWGILGESKLTYRARFSPWRQLPSFTAFRNALKVCSHVPPYTLLSHIRFFHCRLLLQRKELHTEDKKNNKIFIYRNTRESGIWEMACSAGTAVMAYISGDQTSNFLFTSLDCEQEPQESMKITVR